MNEREILVLGDELYAYTVCEQPGTQERMLKNTPSSQTKYARMLSLWAFKNCPSYDSGRGEKTYLFQVSLNEKVLLQTLNFNYLSPTRNIPGKRIGDTQKLIGTML